LRWKKKERKARDGEDLVDKVSLCGCWTMGFGRMAVVACTVERIDEQCFVFFFFFFCFRFLP
jgi:hypothetical protein